jgi:hypothetical protein
MSEEEGEGSVWVAGLQSPLLRNCNSSGPCGSGKREEGRGAVGWVVRGALTHSHVDK